MAEVPAEARRAMVYRVVSVTSPKVLSNCCSLGNWSCREESGHCRAPPLQYCPKLLPPLSPEAALSMGAGRQRKFKRTKNMTLFCKIPKNSKWTRLM
jgi:hypothetical protein